MLARLHTAVSLSSEYSIISEHWEVIIPLNIPACLSVSLKQYVLSRLPLSITCLIVINGVVLLLDTSLKLIRFFLLYKPSDLRESICKELRVNL